MSDFWWVVYQHDLCKLSTLISDNVLERAEALVIPQLRSELDRFAKGYVPPQLHDTMVKLRKVRFFD